MIGFGEARAGLENKNNSDELVRQTIFASMTFQNEIFIEVQYSNEQILESNRTAKVI